MMTAAAAADWCSERSMRGQLVDARLHRAAAAHLIRAFRAQLAPGHQQLGGNAQPGSAPQEVGCPARAMCRAMRTSMWVLDASCKCSMRHLGAAAFYAAPLSPRPPSRPEVPGTHPMSVPVSPSRTKAAEKRASREATRTSDASASAKPPPAAAP